VDAYDALTIEVVLDQKPARSIMEVDGGKLWSTRQFQVAGRSRTLDDVETEARALGVPRVHAALNCASRGCPPLPPTPLTGDHLDDELDAAARHWVATDAYTLTGDTIALSHVFEWYAGDFASYASPGIPGADAKQSAALHFIATYASAAAGATITS